MTATAQRTTDTETANPADTGWSRRQARTLTVVLAVVLVALFVGDRIGGLVLDQVIERSKLSISQVYAGGIDADIVFVGDSHAVYSFFPLAVDRRTNRKSFNAAYDEMTAPIADALTRDYLDRNRTPDTVVLEVSNALVTGQRESAAISNWRPYSRQSRRMRAAIKEAAPFDARLCRLFWLTCHNSEMTIRAALAMKGKDIGDARYGVFDGRVSKSVREGEAQVDDDGAAIYARLVHDLEARGIEVKLIVTPFSPSLRGIHRSFPRTIEQLEQVIGAPVADYSDAITTNTLFNDPLHLNTRGMRVFLDELVHDGFFERDARRSIR